MKVKPMSRGHSPAPARFGDGRDPYQKVAGRTSRRFGCVASMPVSDRVYDRSVVLAAVIISPGRRLVQPRR
ncbi:hypothetical protein LNQ03_03390 [Klebsiella pneumoniae subsp. pneumoniae]|nr:hypothetical protein [Klebsiella pneumoniae subsp. pneumoniae]